MAITAQELMKARLLDAAGVGQQQSGGGGAVDHARSQAWARFINSQLGKLIAAKGGNLQDAFEQQYYGGAMPFQYGVMPNPDDLNRWVDKATSGLSGAGTSAQAGRGSANLAARQALAGRGTSTMGPYGGQALTGGVNGFGQPGVPGVPGAFQPTLLNAYLASAGKAFDDRNAAVKARENEIRASKDALYNRTMEGVQNWGKAEEQKTKDTYDNRLNEQLAYLAEHGLGGSTVGAAFKGDKERDQRDALQNLSERVDARRIGYDIPLTQNKEDFVERITDRGPSMQEIMQVAQQLGASGIGSTPLAQLFGGQPGQVRANGAGMRSGAAMRQQMAQPGYTPMTAASFQPQQTMTPWGPVQRASYYPQGRQPIATNIFPGNPMDPMSTLDASNSMVQSLIPQAGGTGSNAYPVTPGQRRRDALAQMTPEQQQQEQQAYALEQLANQMEANAKRTQWIAGRQSAYNQSPYAQHRASRLAMQQAGLYGQPIKPIPQSDVLSALWRRSGSSWLDPGSQAQSMWPVGGVAESNWFNAPYEISRGREVNMWKNLREQAQ